MGSSSAPEPAELGSSIPVSTAHAVSVSLPRWKDNVDYELGKERVISRLQTGYPRFFVHREIQNLAELCQSVHGLTSEEKCMLFPSDKAATFCRNFVTDKMARANETQIPARNACRIVRFVASDHYSGGSQGSQTRLTVFAVFVPNADAFTIARTFWQHTGLGISSRFAQRCLRLMNSSGLHKTSSPPIPPSNGPSGPSRRYSAKNHPKLTLSRVSTPNHDEPEETTSIYVEERYGRNLPIQQALEAKFTLRRRIADILQEEQLPTPVTTPTFKKSQRGSGTLNEQDVYLYPNGMSSIFFAHQLSMAVQTHVNAQQPVGKSVCFGFPYTDTLKIIQKWGPGAHFFGHGGAVDLEALERLLDDNSNNSEPTLAALFCEFPSNPLLKSPDLLRIRQLADRDGFLVIIDETIGNFMNVEVLEFADMLVSSLTKVFSGDSNVMGGSLVLNPSSPHYQLLKKILDGTGGDQAGMYEDIYFAEDAIYMERNSRDFHSRVKTINSNALALTEYLVRLQKERAGIIKEIYYPRYITTENYERCRRKPDGGYGGLFSLTFTSLMGAEIFYDSLNTLKGPSLGTNFTLASPYAILAHFHELEWASQFGVEENLIRVSVGLEGQDVLFGWFQKAFEEAEKALDLETQII